MDRRRGFGWHGSALVVVDGQRVSRAVTLVLQEMGLAVDVADGGVAALRWTKHAAYTFAICGGEQEGGTDAVELAIGMRNAAPQTRVILLAGAGITATGLDAAGVEVLPAPFDVNRLVERLWPAAA